MDLKPGLSALVTGGASGIGTMAPIRIKHFPFHMTLLECRFLFFLSLPKTMILPISYCRFLNSLIDLVEEISDFLNRTLTKGSVKCFVVSI